MALKVDAFLAFFFNYCLYYYIIPLNFVLLFLGSMIVKSERVDNHNVILCIFILCFAIIM